MIKFKDKEAREQIEQLQAKYADLSRKIAKLVSPHKISSTKVPNIIVEKPRAVKKRKMYSRKPAILKPKNNFKLTVAKVGGSNLVYTFKEPNPKYFMTAILNKMNQWEYMGLLHGKQHVLLKDLDDKRTFTVRYQANHKRNVPKELAIGVYNKVDGVNSFQNVPVEGE